MAANEQGLINEQGKRLSGSSSEADEKRFHGDQSNPSDASLTDQSPAAEQYFQTRFLEDFPFYNNQGSPKDGWQRLYSDTASTVMTGITPYNINLLHPLCHPNPDFADIIDASELHALARNLVDIISACEHYNLFYYVFHRASQKLLDTMFASVATVDCKYLPELSWRFICRQAITAPTDYPMTDVERRQLSFYAVVANEPAMLTWCLTGLNPNQIISLPGRPLLHLAAGFGTLKSMTALLQMGAAADVQDAWQNTPLHLAASRGQNSAIERLVKHTESINAPNESDSSPLQVAIACGHTDAAARLISAGSDFDRLDPDEVSQQPHIAKLLVNAGYYMTEEVLDGWFPLSLDPRDAGFDEQYRARNVRFDTPQNLSIYTFGELFEEIKRPKESKIITFLQQQIVSYNNGYRFGLVARNWISGFCAAMTEYNENNVDYYCIEDFLLQTVLQFIESESKTAEISRLEERIKELEALVQASPPSDRLNAGSSNNLNFFSHSPEPTNTEASSPTP